MPNKETKKTESARKQPNPILYILTTIALVALLIGGFFVFKQSVNHIDYRKVAIGDKTFTLELANTKSEREKGLSEREPITSDAGMLFDFGKNGDWQMWMLQMRFPIDMAWVTKDGKIVHIKPSAQPGDYPDVYHAEQPSWYVVEVPAGTFANLGVHEGDTIKL
jgi:uncharacterized membrane protein (UPF0127 family)